MVAARVKAVVYEVVAKDGRVCWSIYTNKAAVVCQSGRWGARLQAVWSLPEACGSRSSSIPTAPAALSPVLDERPPFLQLFFSASSAHEHWRR